MKDTPDEIASVMNLILPTDQQFPVGDEFLSNYLDKHGPNQYTVKKNQIKYLKQRFKGRISFLKSMRSSVKKEFIGETGIGKLKHFIVNPVKMSPFQSKIYKKALELDSAEKAGVYLNSRQASIFVFPDGSYGQPRIGIGENSKADKTGGFAKYVEHKASTKTFVAAKIGISKKKNMTIYKYTLSKVLVNLIKGPNDKKTLENLRKYSVKFAYIIERILNADKQCCFVYCEFVTGSGAILFAKILELFNFSESKGLDGKKGLRYGLLTSQTSTPSQISQTINCFNQPINKHGEIIKVLIGSRIISEGVSFYNIQQEFILTPWYNFSETDQAIARGYRLGSHKILLENGEDPTVYVSLLVAMPEKDLLSVDLYMYEISEDKDITIKELMRLLMESAFDCSLNYHRNYIGGYDEKRECDYVDCDYKCDDVDMKNIIDGVQIEELDYSTYQLYYSDQNVLDIRKKLEKYFKNYNNSDIASIINFFKDDYTEWEIRNALKTIIKGDNYMYYSDYIKTYSRSSVKKIIDSIQVLFQTHFRMSFQNIVGYFPDYTEFEILTALKKIIDGSVVVKNMFGFSSYLREKNNMYFLVDNLSITDDSFSEYYARKPNVVNGKNFEEIFYDIQIELMPDFIKKLCNIKKLSTFSKMIKSLPEEIQEMFIEAAVLAKRENIPTHQHTRNLVLQYFNNYIHELQDLWVSDKLIDHNNVVRCLDHKSGVWEDCTDEQEEQLKNKMSLIKNILQNNPYGVYGKYNPETKTFSLVNLIAEKAAKQKKYDKKLTQLNKLVTSGKITKEDRKRMIEEYDDSRVVYPGAACTSWKITDLMKIALKIIKLDFPKKFKQHKSDETLQEMISDNKYIGKGSRNSPPVYTQEEILALSREDLQRAAYWAQNKPYKSKLCSAIEKWLRDTKWEGIDMLIPDKEAGTSGGHTKIDKKIEKKKTVFNIVKIIPEKNIELFKTYFKDIEKMMNECFKIKKYKPDIDDKQWIIVFLKKRLVGFLVIDEHKVIWNVCVAENYRRRGIAQKALQFVIQDICPTVSPRLMVNNISKTYNRLIKLYKTYGFTILTKDKKTTVMEFKCS